MNTPLPLESTLTLYNDTVCRDTGQYFCNLKPFSMPRTGNTVSLLSSGKAVLKNIHTAMMAATSFIWIADWQMAFDVELVRGGAAGHPGRLHNVIKAIISTKPVHVRVLLFCSVKDTIPGTYDGLVANELNALNKKGYPGSVHVLLQPPTSAQNDSTDYSHHQKFVVVDGQVGFIGGIDLSYGRWETSEFDVVVDPDRFLINDMYNPNATKLRPASKTEQSKIDDYHFALPYGGTLIDEGCQPRMPWQDVHIKLEGPSVVDMHRNFARRWNSRFKQMGADRPLSVQYIEQPWLTKIGAWRLLTQAQPRKAGGAQVQIVRSVSSDHLKLEGTSPQDLFLYPDARERAVWNECLSAWKGDHQPNILNAVVNCIRSADNYIYIETQFFISQFGTWGEKQVGSDHHTGAPQKIPAVDSSKIGNENDGIKNIVVDELAARIGKHIVAALPFHVYIVIPTHPEGPITDEAVWKQHWLALVSIKHGSNSLINRIKKSLIARKRDPQEWVQYLTILNMRNYGATVQYARDPKTFDEDFSHEIGRFVVTEQIYIHSKLMIVDDAVAIVGSANTNDRSLTGNGDTEIAAVVVDTEGVELRDLGSPQFKVQTRQFARELRRQLWSKHFGFLVESEKDKKSDYFRSTTRAVRAKKEPPAPLIYPPRFKTSEGVIYGMTSPTTWQSMLDKPCAPETIKAIQNIAAHNARIYEQVFQHTPRNSMKTFDAIAGFYTLPYPARMSGGRNDGDYKGVVPPALKPQFMTTHLLAHQQKARQETRYTRRQQLYADGTVHDVDKAIDFLRKNIIGFFVAPPLDWGMGTEIKDDPSKATIIGVDISSADTFTLGDKTA